MAKRIYYQKALIFICFLGVPFLLAWYYELGAVSFLQIFKSKLELWELYVQQNPIRAYALYGLLYIFATAISFPGAATTLTLGAGALFGWVGGVVLVSFSSTCGATLAFLSARFLLRDWVRDRWQRQLKNLDKALEREGAFYLFALRLTPLLAFFCIKF